MRKLFIFTCLCVFPLLVASCGSAARMNKADQPWSYEVESVGVGAEGTYVLRVWSWYRTPDMPVNVAGKNAVHAVIFKGVPAGGGASAQPPLYKGQISASDSLFFDGFFTAAYQNYVNSVASGSRQVLKTGNREYKIGYVVSVAKDNLRKYLETQGVVKALSEGF
ncbi:MAG TPA: hypothetical protein IAC04_04070 [Candidatus Coprenecus stercoravium]|uniref:Lipoprotein n=1 Tax=Candidatus Coprenecus stercoravium TaxID=2840735 RepID=A0A9D2GQD3_9BACT|nr:hypothetical protein [Candidatus Coprenecus stercoravium]